MGRYVYTQRGVQRGVFAAQSWFWSIRAPLKQTFHYLMLRVSCAIIIYNLCGGVFAHDVVKFVGEGKLQD